MSECARELWLVEDRTLYTLNARGTNRLSASIESGRDDDDQRVKHSEAISVAAKIARCLNAHNELVAALRAARLQVSSLGTPDDSINNAVLALCDAALAKASPQ